MVTSRGDKENVVQAIQAGVSDYMGKPFSNEQLAAKVKKALQRTGKLAELQAGAQPRPATGFANDSLGALTAGRSDVVQPTAAPVAAPAAASSAALLTGSAPPPPARGKPAANFGQGQLRLPNASMACLIKAISIKEALLVVRRGDPLPQILETAVLDLEQAKTAMTWRASMAICIPSARWKRRRPASGCRSTSASSTGTRPSSTTCRD